MIRTCFRHASSLDFFPEPLTLSYGNCSRLRSSALFLERMDEATCGWLWRVRGGKDSEQTAQLSTFEAQWAVSQREKKREEREKEIGVPRKGQCGGLNRNK